VKAYLHIQSNDTEYINESWNIVTETRFIKLELRGQLEALQLSSALGSTRSRDQATDTNPMNSSEHYRRAPVDVQCKLSLQQQQYLYITAERVLLCYLAWITAATHIHEEGHSFALTGYEYGNWWAFSTQNAPYYLSDFNVIAFWHELSRSLCMYLCICNHTRNTRTHPCNWLSANHYPATKRKTRT
jgi:hypothetical protein